MEKLSTHLVHISLVLVVALTLLGSLIISFGQVQSVKALPTVDQFTISIGDTVSDGVPLPGAGNIEGPGEVDIYNFDAVAGQEVIFDWLSGLNTMIGWQLQAPDSTILFDSVLRDWQVDLSQTGTYTLTVDGNTSNLFGTYSFRLLSVPVPQQFSINIGDAVSDGVPNAGAGNLEEPGAVDIYTFSASTGQEIIFDWLSGANTHIHWQLQAPDSTSLFNSALRDQQLVLPQTGIYTLTLKGSTIDRFGLYSFQLLEVPAPQQFAINIGDMVSDGVPDTGAGNLEEPGAVDIYTFSASTGQEIIFDWLTGANTHIHWQLQAPDSTVLFNFALSDKQLVLPQTGVYTLTLKGSTIDRFGLYSFRLLEVPLSQQFAINIGDTVSDGVPASGAGNLEEPGAVDIYTFNASMGQEVIFDWLSGANTHIHWQLQAPDSTSLFDSFLSDKQLVLPQTGIYTLTLSGSTIDRFGLYSFHLLEAPTSPQQFAINFGDTISDGIPATGAGNLEAPGAVDIYTFDAVAGQGAFFDWLSGSNVLISWQLQASDNTMLFDTELRDQRLTLTQTGSYTLTVQGTQIDNVGVYSFALVENYFVYLPMVTR